MFYNIIKINFNLKIHNSAQNKVMQDITACFQQILKNIYYKHSKNSLINQYKIKLPLQSLNKE